MSEKNILHELNAQVIANSNFDIRNTWYKEYIKSLSYNFGEQWLDPEINEQCRLTGKIQYTDNIIATTVNNYLSIIFNSARRVGCSATTTNSYAKTNAEKSKHWMINTQTNNFFEDITRLVLSDVLIGGLGFIEFYYNEITNRYIFERKDPLYVFPDFSDNSSSFDNQKRIVVVSYKHIDELILLYPEKKKKLEEFRNHNGYYVSTKNTYNIGNNPNYGNWLVNDHLKVIEVYYKELDFYYECDALLPVNDELSQENQFFPEFNTVPLITFNYELAKQKAISEITRKSGSKIYKGVYTQDILLEHGAISEQVPNQSHFPIIPIIYRKNIDGCPYGVVKDLISHQDLRNTNISDIAHYKDSKFYVFSSKDGNEEKDKDKIGRESKKKVGAWSTYNAKEFQVFDNSKISQTSLQLFGLMDNALQRTTGLHNEFNGMIQRETSALAIQTLTQNTYNNLHKNSLLATYDRYLKNVGILMIDTLKGTKNINQLVKYYKAGHDLELQLDDNIALLNLEIFVEPMPNFASSAAEKTAIINEIINTQNPNIFMYNVELLQEKGLSEKDAYKHVEAWKKAALEMAMIQVKAQLEGQKMQIQLQQEMQQQQMIQQQSNGETNE